MHAAGTPAHRLEEAIGHVAQRLGHEAAVFSTPTMMMLGFGPAATQRTVLLRVQPADVHLGRMDRLDRCARHVVAGLWTPAEGERELTRIRTHPQRLGRLGVILVWLAISASTARFFGGGLLELAAGAVIGTAIGGLSLVWPRVMTGAPIFELLGAAVAGTLAGGAASLAASHGLQLSAYVAMLAGVVGLLPGLTLTVAVTELATRHLVSGTARAMAAATTLLQMAVGVALGTKLAEGLFGPTPVMVPVPLPDWTSVAMVVPAALAAAAFSATRVERVLPILVVSGLGFAGARLGATWLGPELGAALGALVVGLASRAHGAWARCPQFLTLVPAILLLVPGSFGFRSVSLFLGADVTSGLDAALRMLLIAMAVSAGLLVAQAAGRPRPTL
jgi:uncharacterized membrane protein YjjP (DUF1212 family)